MDTPSKRQTLLYILIFSFVLGLVEAVFPLNAPMPPLLTLISSIGFLVLFMRWFTLDAQLHGYRFSKPMFLCLVALMVFTAPFYFFATRRLEFWKSLLKSALFFVAIFFAVFLGAVVTLIVKALLHLH